MEKLEILTPEIVDQSYQNALGLLLGNLSFEDLEERGEFYLPSDYDDPQVVLEYFEDIEEQIVQLEKKIRHNKEKDLQKFSDEIKEVLEEEICSRYYLHKGLVESSFDNDVDVKAAIDVLNDQARYKKILSGEKI